MTTIRPECPLDAALLCATYNHDVDGTTISFEEAPVRADDMATRIADVLGSGLPWLVLTDGDAIGYAYATKWRARTAYRHAVESTIYLDATLAGQGHGIRLYASLLTRCASAACTRSLPASRSRTRAVSASTNAWVLPRSRTFQKWASSSGCGSMSGTGRCVWRHARWTLDRPHLMLASLSSFLSGPFIYEMSRNFTIMHHSYQWFLQAIDHKHNFLVAC